MSTRPLSPLPPSLRPQTTPVPPLPDIPGAKTLSWQIAPPGYVSVPPGFWQLVIDGIPMGNGYEQPVSARYAFRPAAGGNSIWLLMERLADFAAGVGVIVEVGIATCSGSTHAFDLGLQASTAPVKRHIGIDIHDAPDPAWEPPSPWWTYLQGDSREASTVERVLKELTSPTTDGYPGPVLVPDLIYIDTMHTYEFLSAEMKVWPALGGPSTLWLFHDTWLGGSFNPMTNAITEAVAEGGPLADTHVYVEVTRDMNGLGALIPRHNAVVSEKGGGRP